MKTCRKKRPATPHRDGAVTVEMALILPIFAILLAGLMEFSHYFMVVHSLNAAARKGALQGSFTGVTNSQVTQIVDQVVQAAFSTSAATTLIKDGKVFDTSTVDPNTMDYSSLPNADVSKLDTGDCFLVQVSVPYNDVALLSPFWIKNATVTGRAVMRHE